MMLRGEKLLLRSLVSQAASALGNRVHGSADHFNHSPHLLLILYQLAFDRTERDRVATHADAWVHNTPAARASSAVATAGWATQQWIAFCERLLQLSTELLSRSPPAIIRPSALRALDAALGLSASRNSELRALWGVLAVRSGLEVGEGEGEHTNPHAPCPPPPSPLLRCRSTSPPRSPSSASRAA